MQIKDTHSLLIFQVYSRGWTTLIELSTKEFFTEFSSCDKLADWFYKKWTGDFFFALNNILIILNRSTKYYTF